jgi:hypothetical protein
VRNDFGKARMVLDKVARINKTTPFQGTLQGENSLSADSRELASKKTYGYTDLVRYESVRGHFLIMAFNYFSTALVFYVMTLSLSSYGGDPVTNGLIMGVSELVAVGVAMVMIEKWGRRPSYIFSFVLSLIGSVTGITAHFFLDSCEACVIIETFGVSLLKFGLSHNFTVVTIYITELFPTVVRPLVFGASSLCGRVSSLFCPAIIAISLNAGFNPIL